LYLLAVFLYLEGISNIVLITIFAYAGSFIGDQSSYLMGRVFGTKIFEWNFFRKRRKELKKQKIGLKNMNLGRYFLEE
jgi:membrane protein DedA with SNARE-associated domain